MLIKQDDGTFKSLAKLPAVNWCQLCRKMTEEKNRFAREIWMTLKGMAPLLFQQCPYKGRVDLVNIKIPTNKISYLPMGKYKLSLDVYYFSSESANASIAMIFEIY